MNLKPSLLTSVEIPILMNHSHYDDNTLKSYDKIR